MKTKCMFLTLILLANVFSAQLSFAGIQNTAHDFSVNSLWSGQLGGNYLLDTGDPVTEVCVFCHTPHGASTDAAYQVGGVNQALWNRVVPVSHANGYSLYSTTSLSISPQDPTGISLMCLSCHDGVTSIAVGTLLNTPGNGGSMTVSGGAYHEIGALYDASGGGDPFLGGGTWGPNIGELTPTLNTNPVNLSNDHPVAFAWVTPNPGIWNDAPRDSRLRLFGPTNRMECSTCHNVHDDTNSPFLAMSNDSSNMCMQCHDK